MGHLQFATEIMMLKPSYAWKLNWQGFSPIHLALQNGQKSMVSRFVGIDKELVRVKGREGITPLHFRIGEVDLLANFLYACPESIQYLTVRCETALHIAVKNEQFEALQVLVGWLEANYKRGAIKMRFKILNQMDEAGNTILHISALSCNPQACLLVMTRKNLKAKNLENKTALDIASTAEVKKILSRAGAKLGSQVTDTPTRAHKLRSKTTIMNKLLILIRSVRGDISEERRNTWLIVATLVATSTYQSALTPPGGVYQVNASDDNMNITSSNCTISTLGNAGKSVLSRSDFFVFSFLNMFSFFVSTMAIFILTPSGLLGALVSFGPVGFLIFCYLLSMAIASPTHSNAGLVNIALSVLFVVLTGCAIFIYYYRNEQKRKLRSSVRII